MTNEKKTIAYSKRIDRLKEQVVMAHLQIRLLGINPISHSGLILFFSTANVFNISIERARVWYRYAIMKRYLHKDQYGKYRIIDN